MRRINKNINIYMVKQDTLTGLYGNNLSYAQFSAISSRPQFRNQFSRLELGKFGIEGYLG
jgi:hypothetical protein